MAEDGGAVTGAHQGLAQQLIQLPGVSLLYALEGSLQWPGSCGVQGERDEVVAEGSDVGVDAMEHGRRGLHV